MKRGPEKKKVPVFALDIVRMAPEWGQALPRCRSLAEQAAAAAFLAASADRGRGRGSAPSLTIALADDRLLRRLNRDYRGKDKPTNVLAFPGEGGEALGDIALALGTLRREAKAAGKPLADHFRHLVIHGILHLLGYDHERAAAARLMEAIEIAALATIGIGDPYRDSARPRDREGWAA